MRIGLITGEYPPMQGGVGAFSQELAKALAAAGHTLHLITPQAARPSSADHLTWSARLEPIDIGFAHLHPRARRWRWPDLSLVAGITHRYNLDLVNIQYQAAAYNMNSPAINFLPWRLRGLTKTVVTFHDLRVPYLFPKAGRLRHAAVYFMARQAHGVIATNPADFQELAQLGIGKERLREIPIGSNITARQPSAAEIAAVRTQLGLSPDDLLLGYFGFLNESKGADTLLQALAQLEQPRPGRTHLVFIGGRTGSSDPQNNAAFYAQLDALIAQLALTGRVHWTDFVPEAQVSTYLHAADLMVMPYRDGVSLRRGTLMAVLAHGRPLITTTPTTPTPALIHGQNVWLTAIDDPAALAHAINTLAANAQLRQQLGEAAAQLAGRFTWDTIAAQTAVFFHEVLQRGHKQQPDEQLP